MRVYEIAAFLFVLNLVAAAYSTIGVGTATEVQFGGESIKQLVKEQTQETERKATSLIDSVLQSLNWFAENIKILVTAIPTFIDIMGKAVNGKTLIVTLFPWTQNSPLVDVVGFLISLIYLVGLIEFVTGRFVER